MIIRLGQFTDFVSPVVVKLKQMNVKPKVTVQKMYKSLFKKAYTLDYNRFSFVLEDKQTSNKQKEKLIYSETLKIAGYNQTTVGIKI